LHFDQEAPLTTDDRVYQLPQGHQPLQKASQKRKQATKVQDNVTIKEADGLAAAYGRPEAWSYRETSGYQIPVCFSAGHAISAK
jgi:hypothetical protein